MALTAITKDFITRGGVQIRGTATVTSSTGQVGGFQVDGGAAVAKNLIVGDGITAYGTSTFYAPIVAAGGLTITGSLIQSTATFGTLTVNDLLTVGGVSAFNNTATFNSALIVSGSNTLTVGTGAATLGGSLSVTGTTVLNSTLSVASTATVGGVLDVNNTDAATSAGAGSLQLAGGAFIEKNVIVSGTGATYDAQNKYNNGLVVENGAWIDDGLFVNGPTTFAGAVTFSGTATYVYSTNTYYTDNFIDMHVPPGGVNSPWTTDDGKDIGLIFHYYKAATDKNAFLGFANDTGYLEWYENGSEVGSVYTGSAYGTFKTGDIRLVGANDATSTTTGALQVVGGAGIGGAVYAGSLVSGSSVYARDLTATRLVLAGTGGQLVDSASLTWDSATSTIQGTITSANTATNLAGGASGSVPYQTAAGVTAFVAIGGEDTVLTSKSGVPTWSSAGSTSVGSATTATNLSGGSAGQIAFQTGTGLTGFDADLTFSTATDTLSVSKVAIASGTNSTSTTTGALTVVGGAGVGGDMYVGGTIYGTATTATSATNLLGGSAGYIPVQTATGQTGFDADLTYNTSTDTLTAINVAATTVAISGTTNSTSTTTGALKVVGGAGVGGDMYVGGVIYSNGSPVITSATFVTPTLQSVTTAGATTNNAVSITNTSSSTSTSTGALTVTGGVGIVENVNVGGYVKTSGPVYVKDAVLDTATLTSTSTSAQTVDTFALATYRTARYAAQVVKGTDVHVTEIVIFHNGTDVYLNEYGIFFNTAELGTFDADISGANVILTFTPASVDSTTVKVVRIALTA